MPLTTQYQLCVHVELRLGGEGKHSYLDTHTPVTHVQKQMGHIFLQVGDKEVWLVYLLGSQAAYLYQRRSFTTTEWLSEFDIHYH